MKVYVIWDDRRPEKYDLFIEELKNKGIEYEIFPAVVLQTSVVESISESFKSIIREAKENKLEMVCIMEDDVCFSCENSWKYFLENMPKEFDVYIAGTYLMDNRLEYKPPLVKVNEWIGNHAIVVHSRYYDKWLESDSKLHCDGAQAGNGEFYLCFPMIAKQRSGLWSSNNHAPQNYNKNVDENYWLK